LKAGQDSDQRRFARTILAEQCKYGTSRYLQVDAAQCIASPKMHLQTFSDYTIVHRSFLEEEGIELEWTIVTPERTRATKQ
jgi:hypothetical protein